MKNNTRISQRQIIQVFKTKQKPKQNQNQTKKSHKPFWLPRESSKIQKSSWQCRLIMFADNTECVLKSVKHFKGFQSRYTAIT